MHGQDEVSVSAVPFIIILTKAGAIWRASTPFANSGPIGPCQYTHRRTPAGFRPSAIELSVEAARAAERDMGASAARRALLNELTAVQELPLTLTLTLTPTLTLTLARLERNS